MSATVLQHPFSSWIRLLKSVKVRRMSSMSALVAVKIAVKQTPQSRMIGRGVDYRDPTPDGSHTAALSWVVALSEAERMGMAAGDELNVIEVDGHVVKPTFEHLIWQCCLCRVD